MTAVFLDRDGVIIRDVDNLTKPEQIELLPNTAKALKLLNKEKIPVIVITNQPVIARGWITEQDIEEIHKVLKEKLAEKNASIDAVYYCPHHPNANLTQYKQVCECRKPEPGMLLQGARDFNINIRDCYLVGDRKSDILAGKKAGCKTTIFVKTGIDKPINSGSVSKSELENVKPDYVCKDILEAVELILKLDGKTQ
jgi:D,D-heptose 1,7-bisphosphate phosphatase